MDALIDASAAVAASGVPVADAATMAEVDRLAIEEYGSTLLQMMEQAGSHLAEIVRLELGGDLRNRSTGVSTVQGNNGGGGLVAAGHLINRGASVRVVLARPALRMTEAGRHQLATLISMGTSSRVATYDVRDKESEHALARADLVVDAILGDGGSPKPHVIALPAAIAPAAMYPLSMALSVGGRRPAKQVALSKSNPKL